MDSQQPAPFSANLRARLSKSATEGGMTPSKANQIFETFLEDKSKAGRTMCGKEVYIFKIPPEIKHSPICIECLGVYKTNLEGCGFRENRTNSTYYAMQPGEFTFIKDAPHYCTFGCQKEGQCYIEPLISAYNDSACHTLMVCL